MTVYVLLGISTEEHGPRAVRHREYTTSEKTARLFAQIPKLGFTDSGHGIVYTAARKPPGKRLPELRDSPHVREHMARLRAEEAERRRVQKRRRVPR